MSRSVADGLIISNSLNIFFFGWVGVGVWVQGASPISVSGYKLVSSVSFQDLPKLISLWVCLCMKIVLLVCVVHFPQQLW